MTEDEWLTCIDPTPMLDYLREKGGGRKPRLFACICCRRIWQLLTDERTQNALMVAEGVTDGLATQRECRAAYAEIRSYADDFAPDEAVGAALHRLPNFAADEASSWSAVACGAAADADWLGEDHIEVGHRERDQERNRQATLLRDIFGNPFRPVTLNPTWQTPAVLALATAAYDNRILPAGTLEPDRLAVLGDALEDAGCDNADILNHLREPGVHVRGCWVLDLLLNKS